VAWAGKNRGYKSASAHLNKRSNAALRALRGHGGEGRRHSTEARKDNLTPSLIVSQERVH